MTDPHGDAVRRLSPRITDTDWLMLRDMARQIDAAVEAEVTPGMTVLDFGCGAAPYRPLFVRRGAHYTGADFGTDADVAIGPNGRLSLPDASMDMVVSFQVLEHVRDLATYFAEIARVLRPGGRLILSTHGTWLYHPHPEDHRRWTRTGLVHDIEAHGFTVDRVTAIVGPLGTTTMIRLTGMAFFLRRIPLVGDAVTALLATIMNLRGLIEEAVTPPAIRDDNGSVYLTVSRKVDHDPA